MTITCADCGSTQNLPLLPARGVAECHRCDRVLDRRGATRFDLTFACAAAIVLLLPVAAFMPLLQSTFRNLLFQESRLISSVPVIYRDVWFPFAFGFLFFAILFPAVRAFFQVLVLGSIRFGWKLPHRGRLFRASEELKIWSMTDVVVLGGLITYFRAAAPADVDVEIGAWCYLVVAILAFTADRTLDRRAVWNAILPDETIPHGAVVVSCGVCERAVTSRAHGDPCPRCGGTLDRDVARLFAPAAGAVAAAAVLCVPAYSYVVLLNHQLTGVWEFTVFGTIQLLADQGMWHFGAVVLVAGVMIPLVELFGLTWLLASVRFPERRGLILRTRVYRLLRLLVRWPMIIPFLVATSAPIVTFHGIDDIMAGPGATPFFFFIALIMLGVRLFEPRLMWKTAGEAA
jgi:paraquat-inducible protein A